MATASDMAFESYVYTNNKGNHAKTMNVVKKAVVLRPARVTRTEGIEEN